MNANESSKPNNVVDYILNRIDQYNKEDIFMVDPKSKHLTSKNSITYSEIALKAKQFCQYLMENGIKKGDIIGLCCNNTLEFAWCWLGSAKAGAITATFSPSLLPSELQHILDLCKPKWILNSGLSMKQQEIVDSFQDIRREQISEILLPDWSGSNVEDENVKLCGDDAVQILMSSGTTGPFKAVLLSHTNFITIISNNENSFLDYGAKALAFIPFFHSFGLFLVLTALCKHSQLYLMEKFNVQELFEIISKYQLTHIHLVPTLLTSIVKSEILSKANLKSIKYFWTGASHVKPSDQEYITSQFKNIKLFHAYGLTEASNITVRGEYRQDKCGSPGTLQPFLQCQIVKENGEICGVGEVGELCFKGPSLMIGYLHNEEATKATIDSQGWLLSGDLGYVDQDGYYFIVDRAKEMIKYQGSQVSPHEIEKLIVAHNKVIDVAVVGIPHEKYEEVPRAYVVRRDQSLLEEEIIDLVKKNLSSHKHLKGGVCFVDAIPKTASGKHNQKELKNLFKKKK